MELRINRVRIKRSRPVHTSHSRIYASIDSSTRRCLLLCVARHVFVGNISYEQNILEHFLQDVICGEMKNDSFEIIYVNVVTAYRNCDCKCISVASREQYDFHKALVFLGLIAVERSTIHSSGWVS